MQIPKANVQIDGQIAAFEETWKNIDFPCCSAYNEVSQMYTELFEAGWCDDTPSEEEYCASKTIALTEGKFDAEVISESLRLL